MREIADWMIYKNGEPHMRIDRRGRRYVEQYVAWLAVEHPQNVYSYGQIERILNR